MRALEQLKDLGYFVNLEEPDHIRLTYHGPGKPDRETVIPLVREIREHKAEALEYLREVRPWDEEATILDQAEDRLPQVPFMLHPGVYVVALGKFLEAIRRDIEAGPQGPRARTGALQVDVKALKRILH